MTMYDYINRSLPPYHDTMYLEGYKPWQIIEAGRRAIYQEYQDRQGQEPTEIIIKGEVKTK